MKLIKEEIKKITSNKMSIVILSIVALIQVLVTIFLFKFFNDANPPNTTTAYAKDCVWFLNFTHIFIIFYSVIINYYLLTKEYIQGTWDLLFAKIANQRKIALAKLLVYTIFSMVSVIISFILFSFICWSYFGHTVELTIILNVMISLLFISSFYGVAQFIFQLCIPNTMIGISSSLLLIFIPMIYEIGMPLYEYIPWNYVGVILNQGLIYNTEKIIFYAIINVLFEAVLIGIFTKKFYRGE
ncbi:MULTISPECIES: ABC transporter permease [unclassified Clostridium]|uniref:ABC transporter permease n=1 Tax=unclassified Clostridium TaxID=2614128 RepID=UPI003F8EBC3E